MSFHTATFLLLGNEPRVTAAARAAVDDAEQRLGIPLPSSVREWYERDGAIRILAEHSNDDPPIKVPDLTVEQWQSQTLIPIRHENQGVCTWAICLDGTDDPPVLVDVDTNGREWHLLAHSFSEYVYSCVWDWSVVLHQPALVQSQNCELSTAAIEVLAAKFREEVRTYGWPGSMQYRFHGVRHGILIWTGDGQADWHIGASDAQSLRIVLEAVWDIDALGDSLYHCSEIGRSVLTDLRRR
jgi:hypothetical protein